MGWVATALGGVAVKHIALVVPGLEEGGRQ